MKHLGRKLYHVIGGLCLLSLYYIFGRERALVLYAGLFILVLAADLLRLAVPSINRFVYSRFSGFIRKNEEHTLTGTEAYIFAIGLSFYLFPDPIAAAAVCFLACGDVAATTVGERYGRRKIGKKSLEGTAAFFAASVCAGFILPVTGIPVRHEIVLLGAFVAAGAELLPLPLNDNLTIPLISAGSMDLVSRLTGWTS